MKSDVQIQKDVQQQLNWEPFLTANEIGVAVKNGVVTLSGEVNSYSKKIAAERAAKSVAGVKAVAEDIQISVYPSGVKTDAELAAAVVNALKWHTMVQEEKVKIKVENAIVTLEGEVDWEYQKAAAKLAVEHLSGVRAVINLVTIKPTIVPTDVQKRIEDAFKRNALLDAHKITVQTIGSKVILSGTVRTYDEKEAAYKAAWAAPGVTALENRLSIEEVEYAY